MSWQELVQLNATCRQLHAAVQDDSLWRNLAVTDYDVPELTGRVLNTFKKLYQRLLHPYGWMVGLYWSRIDYFGGLLELKVQGDSLVATSLRVSDAGVLQGSPCFEVCAATGIALQRCSMIERAHATQITQGKDRESLRQKCQFHDTKFAQGHYNYNTLDGFRAMTFIDAHRLGIVHHPLIIPPLSSIPRELWTTTPPNVLTCNSHGSSPNFFEGSAAYKRRPDTTQQDENDSLERTEPRRHHHETSDTSAISSTNGKTCEGESSSERQSFDNFHESSGDDDDDDDDDDDGVDSGDAVPASSNKNNSNGGGGMVRNSSIFFDLLAACHGSDTLTDMELSSERGSASQNGGCDYTKQNLNRSDSANTADGDCPNVMTMSSDSLSASNVSHSSTNDSINTTSSDSSDNLAANMSGRGLSAHHKAGTSSSTNHTNSAKNNSNRKCNTRSGAVLLPSASPSGNPRQELAQLYRETYCNPFININDSFSPGISASPSSHLSNSRHDLPYRRPYVESHIGWGRSSGGAGCSSSSSLSSLPPLPLCVEPKELPPHVLKPGLYTAHYGPHGYEIVLLEYKIREISLLKILGDQYVPAREVTVKICLPFSFSLTAEQQRQMTCEELLKLEPESSKLPLSHHQQQPFLLPPFCSPGVETAIPTTCWARYHGFGQLANLFHSQPKFSRVHVVVFNNDRFGLLFLALKTFMVFRRLDRDFVRRPNILRCARNGNG